MEIFENIKGILGFGCMRLPMNGEEVDCEEFSKMIDAYIGAGFNYFDTAHGYIDGKSERAIGECLSPRYKREDYVLADKLSEWYVEKESDIEPFLDSQLKICGVDYFDFYLVHSVHRKNYDKFVNINAFKTLKKLKEKGKIRHIAMSFHDSAEMLDEVLSANPEVEAVQLQINYLDYDAPGVQSKACYDVAVKHGKKVIVMEPVKGGALANLPREAEAVFDALGKNKSYASYALRYAGSLPEVFMVLSGMGSMEMMEDNISTMKDFVPLDEAELRATDLARETVRRVSQIGCTACDYCKEGCPKGVRISESFMIYNDYVSAKKLRSESKKRLLSLDSGPLECIGCGKCEKICPQGIEIRKMLSEVAKKFS